MEMYANQIEEWCFMSQFLNLDNLYLPCVTSQPRLGAYVVLFFFFLLEVT